jgi:hypothetical protein
LEMTSAVIEIMAEPAAPNKARLLEVREKARSKRLWETSRDCDLFLALATEDLELLKDLYFSSPFAGYRERILRLYGKPLDLGETRDLVLRPSGEPRASHGADAHDAGPVLDLRSGEEDGLPGKPGRLVHRLLSILLADPYHPLRAEAIFVALFPDEFFDVSGYAKRVHNVLARLRVWLKKRKIPLAIADDFGEYRVEATAPLALRLYAAGADSSPADHVLRQIRAEFKDQPFSSQEVSVRVAVSYSTAKRILAQAAGTGAVVKVGKGRSTRYKFAA